LLLNPDNGMILSAENLSKTFASSERKGFFSKKRVFALKNVSLQIAPGEKIGLIGRSGSGKSTLIRCLAKLIEPDEGKIFFKGLEISAMSAGQFRPMRKHLQVIFQNNYSALNPGMRIRDMLRETARFGGFVNGIENLLKAQMHKVSLSETLLERFPRELSGGECRRIGVAMVDLIGPELLLADEPVTALDYINKWEMLSLFRKLNTEKGTALLFATHDLEAMIDFVGRVVVLFGGHLVEDLPIELLWEARHPHTVELVRYHGFLKDKFTETVLLSYNSENKESSLDSTAGGCIFARQCQRFRVMDFPSICIEKQPELIKSGERHWVACHFGDKVIE
jgi:peptide/nickel transport system ATP-binding protein